eukprot:402274-Prorocentrum_minimum.AAC.1
MVSGTVQFAALCSSIARRASPFAIAQCAARSTTCGPLLQARCRNHIAFYIVLAKQVHVWFFVRYAIANGDALRAIEEHKAANWTEGRRGGGRRRVRRGVRAGHHRRGRRR